MLCGGYTLWTMSTNDGESPPSFFFSPSFPFFFFHHPHPIITICSPSLHFPLMLVTLGSASHTRPLNDFFSQPPHTYISYTPFTTWSPPFFSPRQSLTNTIYTHQDQVVLVLVLLRSTHSSPDIVYHPPTTTHAIHTIAQRQEADQED